MKKSHFTVLLILLIAISVVLAICLGLKTKELNKANGHIKNYRNFEACVKNESILKEKGYLVFDNIYYGCIDSVLDGIDNRSYDASKVPPLAP